MNKKFLAEVIGTFVLVLMGTGTAVLSGGDILITALAFGLAVAAMAFSVGNISGGHFNPAVSLAMLLKKKIDAKTFGFYALAQVVGALLGSLVLIFVAGSSANLGANGINEAVLGTDTLALFKGVLAEIVFTFIFVSGIIGVTRSEATQPYAGLVIGFILVGVIVFGFNLTGVSVNPARSLVPAILQGGQALEQVWVFLVGPFIGGALAALVDSKLQ
jgi:aquaporin Z